MISDLFDTLLSIFYYIGGLPFAHIIANPPHRRPTSRTKILKPAETPFDGYLVASFS
jgi:hypothetical protein